MSPELSRALLTIFMGALAGGLTNGVAVWMLFHPYTPPRIGRFRLSFLQGAVPRNHGRLAAAIGAAVGGRLLTEGDLAGILSRREFRQAFDEGLGALLDGALQKERGSLRELLPADAIAEVEELLHGVLTQAGQGVAHRVHSDAFEADVSRQMERWVARFGEEPFESVLTPERREALLGILESWLEEVVGGADFQQTVEGALAGWTERVLQPGRTFEELLPAGVVRALEQAVAGYLPLAIARLGSALEDPEARRRFEAMVQELLRRVLQDLRFHQRLVARLVLTDDAIDKILDTLRDEGADRLAALLREPELQAAMARGVRQAVGDLLKRPVTSVFGTVEEGGVVEARAAVARTLSRLAGDPGTRTLLIGQLRKVLIRASSGSWGEVLRRLPGGTVEGWVVDLARSRMAADAARELTLPLIPALLNRPIGRPADWLPADAASRLERALAEPLWQWLQSLVPELVQRLDVSGRVEEKVLEFPMPEMEALVRRVTERELRLIVRLGYLLGAIVGGVLVAVSTLIG
jgi:uncharacterized membrane-anchored protein YjiN (DUF445 family)